MDKFEVLRSYGFSDELLVEAEAVGNGALYPARVVAQFKELYRLAGMQGEFLAEVSGKWRHEAVGDSEFPVVGDFVLVDRVDDSAGYGVIHRLLKRKSLVVRKAAGKGRKEQLVAANVDLVFIAMACNGDFNLRRLERYLAVVYDSGALPVVLLMKADLADDLDALLAEVRGVAVGVEVLVSSSWSGLGVSEVLGRVTSGKTVAFIGSSGVGKSTLINALLGDSFLATGEVRADGRGRHVTTRRELFLIPGGGVVIDTPGMRELGLGSADVSGAFVDIDELAKKCRFKDCSHGAEPGCAVREAIDKGLLKEERLLSYFKLKVESGYEGLSAREREQVKMERMFADFGGVKQARDFAKNKGKNR